jgi:hypothetical protein
MPTNFPWSASQTGTDLISTGKKKQQQHRHDE